MAKRLKKKSDSQQCADLIEECRAELYEILSNTQASGEFHGQYFDGCDPEALANHIINTIVAIKTLEQAA